jgi:hypothetical protein
MPQVDGGEVGGGLVGGGLVAGGLVAGGLVGGGLVAGGVVRGGGLAGGVVRTVVVVHLEVQPTTAGVVVPVLTMAGTLAAAGGGGAATVVAGVVVVVSLLGVVTGASTPWSRLGGTVVGLEMASFDGGPVVPEPLPANSL